MKKIQKNKFFLKKVLPNHEKNVINNDIEIALITEFQTPKKIKIKKIKKFTRR